MESEADFLAASKAAYQWLSIIHIINKWGESDGDIDFVFGRLLPRPDDSKARRNLTLNVSYSLHAETISNLGTELSNVSDGPVTWEQGQKQPGTMLNVHHSWRSAHEAAKSIALLTLDFLVWPLDELTDQSEQWKKAKSLYLANHDLLYVPVADVRTWQARIERERGKLIEKMREWTRISKDELRGLLRVGKNAIRPWIDGHAPDIKEETKYAKFIYIRNTLLDTLKEE